MENVTYGALVTAAAVVMALCGGIAVLGRAFDVIKGWKRPDADMKSSVARVRERLDAHDSRLDEQGGMLESMCVALMALINHQLNDGNESELRSAMSGLNTFLIKRRSGGGKNV